MPNGKPADHSLTDLFLHGLPAYGPEAGLLIRQHSKCCSDDEVVAWWEREIASLDWGEEAEFVRRARTRLDELKRMRKPGTP